MKTVIIIDEIKDMDIMDVQFLKYENGKQTRNELKEDLNFIGAEEYVKELIKKYNMKDEHEIVNYVFDQESNLLSVDKETVGEFLN